MWLTLTVMFSFSKLTLSSIGGLAPLFSIYIVCHLCFLLGFLRTDIADGNLQTSLKIAQSLKIVAVFRRNLPTFFQR